MHTHSSQLPELTKCLRAFPALALGVREPERLKLVIDANFVFSEITFSYKTKKKGARSALAEILEARAAELYAPKALEREVRTRMKNLESSRISRSMLMRGWLSIRQQIKFIDARTIPRISSYGNVKNSTVDKDDLVYIRVQVAVGAQAILSHDNEFKVKVNSLIPYRDYSRAKVNEMSSAMAASGTTVLACVSVASGVKALGLIIDTFSKLPWWVQFGIAAGVAYVLSDKNRRRAISELFTPVGRVSIAAIAMTLDVVSVSLESMAKSRQDADNAWVIVQDQIGKSAS